MRNALSMDLYRLRKTKSSYITYFIFIAFLALSMFMIKTSVDSGYYQIDGKISNVIEIMTTGNSILFLLVIFVAMFINAEFSSGYIKNIMGDIPKKRNYVLSKFVTIMLYTALYLLTAVIIAVVGAKVLLDYNDWGNIGKTLLYLGIVYLLNVSFCCIMIFITILLRNSAASTSVGVIYTLMIGSLLYQLINYLVAKISEVDNFDVRKYFVYGNLCILNSSSNTEDFIRAVVVAFLFGVVTILGSIQLTKRRDV